jgi:hypothetical protein
MGHLAALDEGDLERLGRSAHFYDAWGGNYFLDASRALDVPLFDILATVPQLRVPEGPRSEAARELSRHGDCRFVALNLAKYGPDVLRAALEPIRHLLGAIGTRTDVRILNLYSRRFRFAHWPEDVQRHRADVQRQEAELLDQLSYSDDRIVSLVDLDTFHLAAVLSRSAYFIGVDNGIRHLAWALGVRSTVLMPELPDPHFAIRWVHDYHRVITPDTSPYDLARHHLHLSEALGAPPPEERGDR